MKFQEELEEARILHEKKTEEENKAINEALGLKPKEEE